MTLVRYSLVLLLLIATGGCNQGPRARSHIELMSAERRWLEDQLYAAQDDLKEQDLLLQRLRRENKRLREAQGIPSEPSGGPEGQGAREAPLPDALSTLTVELGSDAELDRTLSGDSGNSETNAPVSNADLPAPVSSQLSSPQPAVNAPIEGPVTDRSGQSSPSATRIIVDQQRSRLANWDDDEAADGIALIVGVYDADNRPAVTPDGIVVEVWPLVSGKVPAASTRFADWQIDRRQFQQLLANSSTGRVRLELDWPETAPSAGTWRVVVSYQSSAALESRGQFDFTVGTAAPQPRPSANQRSSSASPWTPRPDDR